MKKARALKVQTLVVQLEIGYINRPVQGSTHTMDKSNTWTGEDTFTKES